MKYLGVVLLLLSAKSFAATQFTCADFQGSNVRHYAVFVDTKKANAIVDTIGTQSLTRLKSVGLLESLPPQKLYRFEGAFQGNDKGIWKVSFNETTKKVYLRFNHSDGREIDLGDSDCESAN